MPPIVTSYATLDYWPHATRLIASLKSHGLPYVVLPVPAFSSWQAATQHKPTHLLKLRRQHPGRPIIWIDADAVVVQKPELFDALPVDDFAAYWHRDRELFSGTLYFGATQAADQLLKAWRDGCHDTPDVIDQQILQRVLLEKFPIQQFTPGYSGIRTYGLPASYCHIPGMGGEPVIAHAMVSRGR